MRKNWDYCIRLPNNLMRKIRRQLATLKQAGWIWLAFLFRDGSGESSCVLLPRGTRGYRRSGKAAWLCLKLLSAMNQHLWEKNNSSSSNNVPNPYCPPTNPARTPKNMRETGDHRAQPVNTRQRTHQDHEKCAGERSSPPRRELCMQSML